MIFAVMTMAMLMAGEPAAAPKAEGQPTQVAPADVKGETLTFGIIEGKNVPKTEKVCFKDPVLGSRIPTKRCMSREQFYERQQESKDLLSKMQREVDIPQP